MATIAPSTPPQRAHAAVTATGTVAVHEATVAVAVPAAAEGAPVPAAAADVWGVEEPTLDKMVACLTEHGLLSPEEGLGEEQVMWQYNALSKCVFGKAVG